MSLTRTSERDAACTRSPACLPLKKASWVLPVRPLSDQTSTDTAAAELGRVGQLAFATPRSGRAAIADSVLDEALLKCVSEGDKAAMHTFFLRHKRCVFRYVQRIVRNQTIAQDVVSHVFLHVWRSASRFESRARVSIWLLAISRFKSLTEFHEPAHESIDDKGVQPAFDEGDEIEAAIDLMKECNRLRECVGGLSLAHREVIELFYCNNLSVFEISAVIGVPAPTVKNQLFYARKALARSLLAARCISAAMKTIVLVDGLNPDRHAVELSCDVSVLVEGSRLTSTGGAQRRC